MELGAPLHLGGRHYVTAVSVGRDTEDETVWDCPFCNGRGFADEWHLCATVRDTAADRVATHRFCADDCLRDWLRLAA